MSRLRTLLIVPYCDRGDVGESWWGYQLARRLTELTDATVLSRFDSRTSADVRELLPAAREVRLFEDPPFRAVHERLNAMLKPSYAFFARWAREQAEGVLSGSAINVVHQFTPFAMRYPCPALAPAAKAGVPLVFGPIGGSIPTPDGFRAEMGSTAWYTRLRGLDSWRWTRPGALRRTYEQADVLLGVAPYVRELLGEVEPKRFEIETETGVESLPDEPQRPHREPGELRLLYVGRVVRNKGVRDAVRAMGLLADMPGVTLDVVGKGEDLDACRREAEATDAAVRFHGWVDREGVDEFYRNADAFCFPSFREPSGTVVLEAMSWGLAMLIADAGGPAYTVGEGAGLRVQATDPDEFARELAERIRTLAGDQALVRSMGAEARASIERDHLWDRKAERYVELYEGLIEENAS